VCENRQAWGAEERDAQDCVLGYSQPSLRDWFRYDVIANLENESRLHA
jgi:hypothetical protein